MWDAAAAWEGGSDSDRDDLRRQNGASEPATYTAQSPAGRVLIGRGTDGGGSPAAQLWAGLLDAAPLLLAGVAR